MTTRSGFMGLPRGARVRASPRARARDAPALESSFCRGFWAPVASRRTAPSRPVHTRGCKRAFAGVCARGRMSVDILVGLNLDANALLVSLLIGCIGLVCFVYGKMHKRFPQIVAGVPLPVYPYFASNVMLMAGIPVAILLLLGVAER